MKTQYSKCLSIFKICILQAFLLNINQNSALSADLIDKWKSKADVVVDKVKTAVPLNSELMGEMGGFFETFLNDFEAKRQIFEKEGFFADYATAQVTLPPAIAITFRIKGTPKDTKDTDLSKSMSDTPFLKSVLETLILIKKNKTSTLCTRKSNGYIRIAA
jgi:hypothetical protein